MKPKGVVEVCHEVHGHLADRAAKARDADRANVLGLRLGLDPKAGLLGREQHLERVDACDLVARLTANAIVG